MRATVTPFDYAPVRECLQDRLRLLLRHEVSVAFPDSGPAAVVLHVLVDGSATDVTVEVQ